MTGLLLSDATVALLRGVQATTYPDVFTVKSETGTFDTGGGYTPGATSTVTGPCRLRDLVGGGEQAIADRLTWTVAYAIDLPLETAVTPANTITVNGRTFAIGGVVDTGAWAVKRTLIVKEQG